MCSCVTIYSLLSLCRNCIGYRIQIKSCEHCCFLVVYFTNCSKFLSDEDGVGDLIDQILVCGTNSRPPKAEVDIIKSVKVGSCKLIKLNAQRLALLLGGTCLVSSLSYELPASRKMIIG